MRSILLSLTLMLVLAGSAIAQLPDSCIVTGTLYNPDMTVAAYVPVKVIKLVKSGRLVSNRTYTDSTDANGYIRLRLWRASEAWIYSPVIGLDASPMTGTKLIIPDAATADLQLLPTSTTVPNTYVVAVPNMRVITPTENLLATTIRFTGTGVYASTVTGDTLTIDLSGGTGGPAAYGDSIRIADSLARLALTRRTYISRLIDAIVIDSSQSGRYIISLNPDSVTAWLQDRDSSMTWMLGRIVQLQDSGLALRGYITPTQIRSMLAGYSLTGHAHSIADVSGLSAALADSVSYRSRMTTVEGDLKVVHDTLKTIRDRADAAFNLATVHAARTDNPHITTYSQVGADAAGAAAAVQGNLTTHTGTADAHLPAQSGATANKFLQSSGTATSWQTALTVETDPTAIAKAQAVVSDTMKSRPYGLKTPGTLGQVWKTLPGGAQGWGADSAGSGGGSSIDTNRIVRNDTKAPRITATFLSADSLGVGVTVSDSAQHAPTDSLTVNIVYVQQPTSSTATSLTSGTIQKMGYVDFVLTEVVGSSGFSSAHMVVADTANGARIIAIYAESVLYVPPAGATEFAVITPATANTFNTKVTWGVTGTSPGYNAKPDITDVRCRYIGSFSSAACCADPAFIATTKLRISFSMPTGSASTWYIKINKI